MKIHPLFEMTPELARAARRVRGNVSKAVIDELEDSFREFQDVHNVKYNALQEQLDRVETILNRPDCLPTSGGGKARMNPEHAKAFDKFARFGDESAMREYKAVMTTTKGGDGGFLIPEAMDTEIDRLAADESAMRAVCDVKRITTPEYLHIVSVGGIESGWVGETETRTETDTSDLEATKPAWGTVYAMPKVSQDALDFSGFDVQDFLIQEVGSKFGEDEGGAFITGNGIKKPRGILDFPFTSAGGATRPFGTFRYVPSGLASTMTADNLVSVLYSLKRKHRKNSTWLMNSTTAGTIMKFKSGDGAYLWQDSLSAGQPPTLLGRPVELDDFMPDIGTDATPVLIGDFKKGFRVVDLPTQLVFEDGDNAALSDAAAVADGFLLGTEAEASFDQGDDDSIFKIGYRGYKRYVRLTITPAHNTGDAPISAVAILGGAHLMPVT